MLQAFITGSTGFIRADAFLGSTRTSLEISSGVITATSSNHLIDIEGATGTVDDLETINGGVTGDLLVLSSVNSARAPTVKDGADNLQLAGDFTLDNVHDTLTLIKADSDWREMSRSDNG